MSSKVKELRLPIVITADGSKAVAGLRQFQTIGKRLDATIGKWGSAQVSAVGGMLMGYLGIDAAISGLHKLYEYANKIQELSRVYSPAVAAAYGERRVAQHKTDAIAARAASPLALAREKIALQSEAVGVKVGFGQGAEALALTMDQYSLAFKQLIAAQVLQGQEGANMKRAGQATLLDALGIGSGGMAEDILGAFQPPAAAVNDPMQSETLSELQQITRNTRGTK